MAIVEPNPPKPQIILPGDPDPRDREKVLELVRLLSRGMDNLIPIPGTNYKVGLDPVIGLIPVVGDVVAAAVGSYILFAAARLGVPRVVLVRMLLNVGTDAAVGAVPFVGDALDVAFKANAKNAALLEKAVADPRRTRRNSWLTVVGVVLAVIAIAAVGIAGTVMLAKLAWNAVG